MNRFRQVNSFVIRGTRMSRAQQRAHKELGERWILGPEAVHWKAIFPNKKRLVVEIGFGMGNATREVATAYPDWGILGIEVHPPGVGKLLWWMERENLENIRIIQRDAVAVFKEQIPHESVDAVHIWFPDPWHKKKHNKRRLIQPSFVTLLIQALVPGGIIHVATDWEPYAYHIMEILQAENRLKNIWTDQRQRPDWRPLTKFENKGLVAGRVVQDIMFQKTTNLGQALTIS